MTKVEFHVLENANAQQALLAACDMIEKLYAQQKRVYVHTSSLEEAKRLDNLLWIFRDISFIPHVVWETRDAGSDDVTAAAPCVQIGYANNFPQNNANASNNVDVLLNLTQEIPGCYVQYQQVIEVVAGGEPALQQLARERYRQYRQYGCELAMVKV